MGNAQMPAQQEEVIEGNDEEQPLIPARQPTHVHFRVGREQQDADKCNDFVLNTLKISFCSLGLWSNQPWNYIPRVLVSVICVYQAVYDFYVVLGCPGFDCSFLQNSTDSKKPSHHKDDRQIANAVYTIVSLVAVVSYLLFIGCFFVAKRKDSALVPPSELLKKDLDRTDVWCLYFAFVFIATLYLCSVAVFYAIIWNSQSRNSYFNILATGVAAQLFAQWTAITTCHVFAVSSFSLGTFAQDAFRLIQDVQNGTLDDVIKIHEDLCTVVLNTVSAYSVWFVLHWFTYGVGVILSVIYISKELASRSKYGTHTINLVYLGLFFVCHLYLFLLPCIFAAKITSSCTGICEKINCTTSEDWPAGHPFRDRHNIALFISYAKDRSCGFKVGRITFNTSLAWLSFFFGLTGLLYHFF
ncbi:hypothetical protein OS493_011915 [Desmophyllum pertusum]|uniref:Transmembrane protein n=1 Tax=Desmophyllum pertusum TaxID=174260 RepID=A0A9W9YHH6_9CNID|nr:hypothetical protein OS493_011915 [Desmophyllum pertusum]